MNRTRSVSIEQVFKHVSNESNNVNFYQKIVGSVFLDSLVSDHKQNISFNGTSWIKAWVDLSTAFNKNLTAKLKEWKIKCVLKHVIKAQRWEQTYSSTFFLTSALERVYDQCHVPAALPPGMNRYPLHRRQGGPRSHCGRIRKNLPPDGFELCTVQPVDSRYNGYAIQTGKQN